MRIETRQFYVCEKCGQKFSAPDRANKCEQKPVTQDKGVKVGDRVVITAGEGKGEPAYVTAIVVIEKDWGHYAWERYWHTIGLEVKVGLAGKRFLTFDSYEKS